MRTKYVFSTISRPVIIEWLEANKIDYYLDGGGIVRVFVNFTLWSSDPYIDKYLEELAEINVAHPSISSECTNAELLRANYLMICPKKQWISIVNQEDAYRYTCQWTTQVVGWRKANHEEQIDCFQIAKEPSIKTSTAFWHEDTGFAELFTDKRVHDLVIKSNISGVMFKSVYLKNGDCSKNIFQMSAANLIKSEQIQLGHGEKVQHCQFCGKEQYFIRSNYQLHLYIEELPSNQDFFATDRIWGEGRAYPVYVISQRFYRLLKEHKLAGNIFFVPVVEVSC